MSVNVCLQQLLPSCPSSDRKVQQETDEAMAGKEADVAPLSIMPLCHAESCVRGPSLPRSLWNAVDF
jgi:hypothetical protein